MAEPETREPVPYERFQTVVSEKNTLTAEITTLRGEVQKLTEKAATVDTLSTEVTRWKGEAEAAAGRFNTFTEISGALGSNDPDVIAAFDGKYKALPEKDRPTRAAWVEALKAKPEDAPGVLRPWLTPAPGAKGPEPKPAPRNPAAPSSPPNAPAAIVGAEVARIKATCVKTGNWEPWKAFKKANGL
jgi:hypothetical protein